MSIKYNLEQWIAQLDYDDTCDISDRQVSELIRGYAKLEAKCAALAAELKQSQIDAGCYKHGMEASNARLIQVAAENAALKQAFNPAEIPEEAVEAFTETAIMDHDWDDTGEWSWVENDTDVIRAVLEAIKPETPATDAFLAEVRASAVDGAVGTIMAHMNHQHVAVAEALHILRTHAAQLRQEAAQ